jgi:transcription initiation factor TFIIH subunit 4
LNPAFQASLQAALLTPQHPWADHDLTTASTAQNNNNNNARTAQYPPPSPAQILENFHERWNLMLQFLVGMVPASAFKTNVVVPFTYYAGLMALKPRTTDVFEITEKGYVFMLKNLSNQIWDYVIAQISREALTSSDRVEVLSFLFALAYTQFGMGYPVSGLTKAQKQLMFELSEVGLLYLRDKKAPCFYPTPEAINLVFGARTAASSSSSSSSASSSSSGGSASSVDQALDRVKATATASTATATATASAATRPLQIIVETNLQVTAYVSTPLHVALLKIFVEVSVQLPNMVLGRLTRDKSKNAFRMGMKTSRIIDFLTTHAHPHVIHKRQQALAAAAAAAGTTGSSGAGAGQAESSHQQQQQHQLATQSILPANVIDQLQLWENELYRMDVTEAMVVDLRDVFLVTYERFRELVSDLQSAKLLLWVSDRGEKLVSCRHCPEAQAMIQRFVTDRIPKYTY